MDDEELIAVLRAALEERERTVAATEGMLADAVAERDRVRNALLCLEPAGDAVPRGADERPVLPAKRAGRKPATDYAAVARVANEALAHGEPMGTAVRLAFRLASGSAAVQLIRLARRAGHDIGSPLVPPPPAVEPSSETPKPEPAHGGSRLPGTAGNYLSVPDTVPAGGDGTHFFGDGCDHPHGRPDADVVPIRPPSDGVVPESIGRHFECGDDACVYLEFATTRELTAHTIGQHGRPPTAEEKTAIEPRPAKDAAGAD